jgi:hypothetical protein
MLSDASKNGGNKLVVASVILDMFMVGSILIVAGNCIIIYTYCADPYQDSCADPY